MNLLVNGMSEKKFDIRLIERGLSKNTVDPAEIQKYLQSLPDDSESADFVNVDDLAGKRGTKKSLNSSSHSSSAL